MQPCPVSPKRHPAGGREKPNDKPYHNQPVAYHPPRRQTHATGKHACRLFWQYSLHVLPPTFANYCGRLAFSPSDKERTLVLIPACLSSYSGTYQDNLPGQPRWYRVSCHRPTPPGTGGSSDVHCSASWSVRVHKAVRKSSWTVLQK